MSICIYCSINACERCLNGDCYCGHLKRELGDVVRKDPVAGKRNGPTLDFEWGDLPRRKRKCQTVERLSPALEHLKDQPGRWARIAEYPGKTGASNAARTMRNFGWTDYEYTSRRSDENTGSVLWARYLG